MGGGGEGGSRAFSPEVPGKDRRKESQQERRHGHEREDIAPWRREAWYGRLVRRGGELSPPVPSPAPASRLCSFPLQVRSSLGTNILSAMAAFAGTAILLMDFGVTNWVCCLTLPKEWENLEKDTATSRRGRGESLQHQEAWGPGPRQGLPIPRDPMSIWTPRPYPRDGRGDNGEAAQSAGEGTGRAAGQLDPAPALPSARCVTLGTLF